MIFFPKYSIVFLVFLVLLFLTCTITRKRSKAVRWITPVKKEYVKNKNKVIIYHSYDIEYSSKIFVKLSKQITENFCKTHNYLYKQILHEKDFMSPYWIRVYDLYRICMDNIDGTIIMYLDADAVVLRNSISVDQFIKDIDPSEKYDIYISEDPNIDNYNYTGVFNTGCYIVRNTPRSRKLIKEWLQKYNNGNKWELQKDGKWKCSIKQQECSWSSDGYEQGEFSNIYKNNKDTKDVILRLHWSALACTDMQNKNCYVLHLMGHTDKARETTLKTLSSNKIK